MLQGLVYDSGLEFRDQDLVYASGISLVKGSGFSLGFRV